MPRSQMVRCNIKLPLRWFSGAWLGVLLIGSLPACNDASSDAGECTTGSDCASGACDDGVCVSPGTGGAAGAGGGAAGASGAAGQGGASGAAGSGGTTQTGGTGGGFCSPNHDGVITRDEVPLMAGLNAKFLTSGATAVSSAGELQGDGSRLWDLTGALSGDHLVLVETQPLAGKWFEAKYPGATYAARLSESSDLLGVFEVTPVSLLLRGVVSPADTITKTQVTYSPAVVVLDFPLSENKTWTTTSNATGLAQGVAVNYTEKYESFVDAHGTLKAPYGDFPVLRTRVVLTRTVGLLNTVVRSYLFSTECFGTVASIAAKDNEPNAEVSSAAEVRRLSP